MMGAKYIRKILQSLVLIGGLLLLAQCESAAYDERVAVRSPDGDVQVSLLLKNGVPYYTVNYKRQPIIEPSKLGFTFKDAGPLNQNLVITDTERTEFDETWTQPWGEVKDIRNHYNELRISLEESTDNPRRLDIIFRVYDDGLGFRYVLPEQEHLGEFAIMDEQTEFVLAGNHQAWWIPAYQERRYEYLYTQSPINALDVVHTPLTMETQDGLFLSIHEANLTDYAAMTLMHTKKNTLECDLVPWSDGVKVYGATPFQTPWRTIQIAEDAGGLITNYLILNLNEPNKLGDVSWVQPGKYVGIWWAIHIDQYTWARGRQHGATTANAQRYIDFAADNGLDGVLVEGWNFGWDDKWWQDGSVFEFTRPYGDFDIEAVTQYAAERGVTLIGHHETGGAVDNYESQMEAAFAFYHDLGVKVVKTGYANARINGAEWHHGQYMVRHYQRVVETAADYGIMLNVHEPIKDTGLRRTYPNMLTREGARGMEYNAWSTDGGNPPEHETILAFTRMLSGPMDYTPGIFDLLYEEAKPNNRVNTTLAKQLALYVVLYSPLQMAADLPENYEGQPAFQFIADVPVDWQDTKVLHAQIGDYVTIARQDRNSDDWYIGSITDENEPGVQYVAEIYADGPDADWESNPYDMVIEQMLVDSKTTLQIRLAPGGGQAIRIRLADQDDIDQLPRYTSQP
jgi:alpha-glucosidase